MPVTELSVVIPVYNEEGNVQPLTQEVIAALSDQLTFEIIFVDDSSKDNTITEVERIIGVHPMVSLVKHLRNLGQSAALVSGVRQARYRWIATLDGDQQNDPKDLRSLIDIVNQQRDSHLLCMGQRISRKDNWLRKCSSKVANKVRQSFLKDDCLDSGCGIKIFPKQLFLSLPLFKNCHRFLPVLFSRAGALILQVPVSHRPRAIGTSKYGVMNRLWVGIVDLFGVAWLMRRFIDLEIKKDV